MCDILPNFGNPCRPLLNHCATNTPDNFQAGFHVDMHSISALPCSTPGGQLTLSNYIEMVSTTCTDVITLMVPVYVRSAWIPWNLSFRNISFHEKRLQTMLWHYNTRVNSHQRWKQTRFRVCFHLWCELTLALWCHSIVWSIFSRNRM